MGLHVNRPKQSGSGNMNDGNTARRAFSDVTLFSSILGLDTDLLHSFHMILIAISCEYEISALKSKQYSEKTYSLYMEKYPWYPMSPTLHKILIHGAQIIAASVVPLGCLGESASESRNKYYKSDRRSHARQNSRTNNMADVFQRAMGSSDPFLSSISLNKRQQQNQKKKIPKEVIELLKAPNVEPHSDHLNTSDCSTDTDSDADSLCDIVLEEIILGQCAYADYGVSDYSAEIQCNANVGLQQNLGMEVERPNGAEAYVFSDENSDPDEK
ncbi:uncharacterized protein LOC118751966 [Rhagoletis pomonella]|uniref:uncharacterized protein LOC118751966 n=1 Tax=Rhagoletis pomonella TaxID=28610 RepID=UPI00177AB139|nr:uncharacterized protein LOC118751966 [Rhagoletis pomonella]